MQLDFLQYPNSAGYKTGGASFEAAQLVDRIGTARNTKPRILSFLKAQGEPQTAEQVFAGVGTNLNNIRSRLTELMVAGLVEKLEDRDQSEISAVRIHKWRVI